MQIKLLVKEVKLIPTWKVLQEESLWNSQGLVGLDFGLGFV